MLPAFQQQFDFSRWIGRDYYLMTESSKRATLRAELFQTYSRHFAVFAQDGIAITGPESNTIKSLTDFYACPLCLVPFHKSKLEEPRDRIPLTIEDVPPRSVAKGIPKTKLLTCRKCNSETGTRIDRALKDLIRWHDFAPGHSDEPRRCTMEGQDSIVQTRLQLDERGGLRVHIVDKATSPAEKEMFLSGFRKGNYKFTVSFRLPDVSRAWVSILKSAYLLMFAEFGYSYLLFTRSMDRVRLQIREPDKSHIPKYAVTRFHKLPSGCSAPSLNVVSSPEWLVSFLVLLRLQRYGKAQIWGAFLPAETGIDEPSVLYKELATHTPSGIINLQAFQLLDHFPGPQSAILKEENRHTVHEARRWLLSRTSQQESG